MFEVLEHTADIGVRAWGNTLSELFENAALGIQSIAVDLGSVEPRNPYPIQAAAEDLESLFVAWLNEVIYLLDAEHVAMSRFEILALEDFTISARGWGERRDPERHLPRLVVKAATFHQLRVARENGRWVAEVYLDI